MTDTSKRILVFNVNWLGDVIFTTPVFKALKRHDPQSHITCLAVPRVREILECSFGIDEIMIFDEKGTHRGLMGKLQLIAELKRRRFDVVFLLHRSWTRALLVYLARIPQRIGYATKRRGWLLTHQVPVIDRQVHRSDHYLNVIESYGINSEDRLCALMADARSMTEIRHLLEANGISKDDVVVVIHVGANWDLKRWPKENFSALVKRLAEVPRVKIVISGTRKDLDLARTIARASSVKPFILAGRTNLKQLVALMARADLVISADSGPMHMANGVGTDVVALFGPTRPEVTGPRGPGRYVILQKDMTCNRDPCYNLACLDNRCMHTITADEVMAAARGFLKKGKE